MIRSITRRIRALAVLAAVALSVAASGTPTSAAAVAPPTVTIAYHLGISYAPLVMMKERGVLEKMYPGTKFRWEILANGAAIRDGLISGQVQIGAGGMGPFLIGWDRGVGTKLIGSLDQMDMWLMATNPKIKSLHDIKPNMKIALPSPDSTEGIVLKMMAKKVLGNPDALDDNIVSMDHAIGMQALLTGQVVAQLTSPPFEFEELARGAHIVMKASELIPNSTFSSVYATESFYKQYPKFIDGFSRALDQTIKYVATHPKQTAEVFSKNSHGKIAAATYESWLTRKDVVWDITPRGFIAYASFMKSVGLLNKVPSSMKEIEFPTVKNPGD